MEASIINGIFTLVGVIIGGIISYFIAKDAKELTRLKGENERLNILNTQYKAYIRQMGGHIAAYWNLEKLYIKDLKTTSTKAEKTIMNEKRDIAEEIVGIRPTMTQKQVNDILEKL